MAITGVGSSFFYIYNTRTGKISSKDGKEDEFIQYFNGDLSGEDSETLSERLTDRSREKISDEDSDKTEAPGTYKGKSFKDILAENGLNRLSES